MAVPTMLFKADTSATAKLFSTMVVLFILMLAVAVVACGPSRSPQYQIMPTFALVPSRAAAPK